MGKAATAVETEGEVQVEMSTPLAAREVAVGEMGLTAVVGALGGKVVAMEAKVVAKVATAGMVELAAG